MLKLSVIVPVYNCEKYLKETLDSISSQTFRDLEIICVNDGSTDNSVKVIEEFAKQDDRIRIVNKENGGLSSARNAGLDAAKGKYVAFVDGDDLLDSNAFEIALGNIEKVDIVCYGIKVFGDSCLEMRESDNEYYRVKYEGILDLNRKILLNTDVSSCNKIFKMDIINKYKIRYPHGLRYEDANFYWKYMSVSKKACFIDKYFYHYRRHSSSIMASTFKGSPYAIDHLHILKNLYDFWCKNNLLKANYMFFTKIFKEYTIFAYNYSDNDNKIKALDVAREYAKEFFGKKNPTTFIKYLKKGKYSNLLEKDLNFLQKIFSIKKVSILYSADVYRKLTFFGLEFRYKNKVDNLERKIDKQFLFYKNIMQEVDNFKTEKNDEITSLKHYIEYQEKLNFETIQILQQIYKTTNAKILKQNENIFSNYSVMSGITWENMKYLFDKPEYLQPYTDIKNKPNTAIIWGSASWEPQAETILYAMNQNIPLLKFEDGFLRSADTWCNTTVDKKYINGISFTFSDTVHYFDATRESRMEKLLNDKTLIITDKQKQRARKCINRIIETHLTKYNHQPIFEPKIGREGVKKVLVVDQSYGDFSISRGLADENTFREMLECAIRENPDADIIVKTHPDTIAKGSTRKSGYFSDLVAHDNIYTQTEPINPISLIKYVDKVYVCTTQFGFEALMCGKEVQVFGMPFYAGWGLTHDRQKCERRTNTRTLEEVFYIAYIIYSHYVNPDKQCRCEIEEAMDYLLKLREEYFEIKREK